MSKPLTINQAFAALAELEGQAVQLEGILVAYDSGGYELLHYPSAERIAYRNANGRECHPAFWVAFGSGSLQPNHRALRRWSGKRVRVHGTVRPGRSDLGEFHSAVIEAFILQRVSAEERREQG